MTATTIKIYAQHASEISGGGKPFFKNDFPLTGAGLRAAYNYVTGERQSGPRNYGSLGYVGCWMEVNGQRVDDRLVSYAVNPHNYTDVMSSSRRCEVLADRLINGQHADDVDLLNKLAGSGNYSDQEIELLNQWQRG